MDQLPDFKVHPLEGDLVLFLLSAAYLLLILPAISSGGVIGFILLFASLIVLVAIIGNLRGRLSSPWKRIHYSLLTRYAKFAGMLGGRADIQGKDCDEADFLTALLSLLKSVYPDNTDESLKPPLVTALSQQAMLTSEEYLREILMHRQETSKSTQINEVIPDLQKEIAEPRDQASGNFLRLRLVIAYLVEKKYGRNENLTYLQAVFTNQT